MHAGVYTHIYAHIYTHARGYPQPTLPTYHASLKHESTSPKSKILYETLFTHTLTHTHAHAHIHTHTHTRTQMHTCTHKHTHIHTHTHIRTHTHTHTMYMYINTHTHVHTILQESIKLIILSKVSNHLQVINFVPQQQAWIVERFGRYLKTLEPVRLTL